MKKIIFYGSVMLFLALLTGCRKNNTDSHTGNTIDQPSSLEEQSSLETPSSLEETSPTPDSGVSLTPLASPSPSVTTSPTATQPPATTSSPTVTPQTSSETDTTPSIQNERSAKYGKRAEEIMNTMTLEEKVGQMFFVRCNSETALSDIKAYNLGGLILFGNDFENKTKKNMTALIKSYQQAAKIPLLIGVDEEGGTVNRVSKYKTFRTVPFSSPQNLYKEGGLSAIKRDTTEKALLLKSLGINVNLAPVCDVSTNSSDFIYSRSFGKNAKETAEYVKTVVTEMYTQNIGCTLKHFPGYGNNQDTHTGSAIDNRSYESFVKNDFIPFQAGINAGAGSILVSHNIVKSMDKQYPASLSAKVHSILRKELNYDGVVMTDDLSMDAIKEYATEEEAAVLAVNAGNDLLIATDFGTQIPAVINAVKKGKIDKNRLDESVKRILIWKLSLGITK